MTLPMSRRNFLAGTAAVAGAAQSGQLWAAPALKPGVQLYMLAAEMQADPGGTLAKLAAIGYGYVESFPAAVKSIPEFRRMLSDSGLGCPAGHFYFGMMPAEKVLDDASAMGVKYAICSVLPPPSKPVTDGTSLLAAMNSLGRDDFKSMAHQANELGDAASKRGIQFAYHNHNVEFRKFQGGETGYSILLAETDPGLVKLEVDAGWMAAGGADPAAVISANAARVRLLHFKDFSSITPPSNTLGPEAGSRIVDLGAGVAPLKAAFEAARKAGVEHFIVDHDPPFNGKTAFEAAKIDFDFVAGLLAS